MRYNYREGVTKDKKRSKWLLWLFLLLLILGAAYVAINYLSPNLISMPLSEKSTPDATLKKLESTTPGNENRLYLPQINVDIAVFGGEAQAVLKDSAWQQNQAKADGQEALAICAQRFMLGTTPWETRERSPFYNLDKLAQNDELQLDYDGVRYAYRVTRVEVFDGNIAAVKANGEGPRLLLFACSADGSPESWVFVEAEQLGTVTSGDEAYSSSSTPDNPWLTP